MDKEEIEAKKGRDFHILETGRADCSPFTKEDKEIAIGEPYNILPENFELYFMEKDPDYKERMFLIKNYLENKNIFNEITENELDKKIVGEVAARKVIFLCAAGGRLVENAQIASFNLLVNDDAGTGKDYVTGNTLSILPEEFYIHKTRISPTVFTYWHDKKSDPDWSWDGKVFYPEDISDNVLNSEVFKVMCSKGSNATVVIKQKAVDIEIVGKPVIITTAATATPSPELTRRFVILNLDSSEEQTKAIMKRHSNYKKEGIVPEYDLDYTNSLRLLKRVKVKIPFANLIDTHFPIKNIIMRTNYSRFLDFISASAAFHQYLREIDQKGFILATAQDYNIARECFLKLCSNKYMIPLTINQKAILDLFEKNSLLKGSVTQIHPHLKGKMTENTLQKGLQLLVKYGMLQPTTEKDCWNRDLEVYSLFPNYDPSEKLSLPTYDQLQETSDIPQITNLPLENEEMVSKVNKVSQQINAFKEVPDGNLD